MKLVYAARFKHCWCLEVCESNGRFTQKLIKFPESSRKRTTGPRIRCDCNTNSVGLLCEHLIFIVRDICRAEHLLPEYATCRIERYDELENALLDALPSMDPIPPRPHTRDSMGEEIIDGRDESMEVVEEEPCSICLNEGTNVVDEFKECRRCSKRFHGPCIRRWVSLVNSCPMCRETWMTDEERALIDFKGIVDFSECDMEGTLQMRVARCISRVLSKGKSTLSLSQDETAMVLRRVFGMRSGSQEELQESGLDIREFRESNKLKVTTLNEDAREWLCDFEDKMRAFKTLFPTLIVKDFI